MTCKLQHPSTAVVAGPTGCGKSAWVLRVVDNATEMIEPPPNRIYYCYGEYQPILNNYPQVTFHKGLPELSDEVFDGRQPTLMIVDDLMAETNQLLANIFTKISHHRNISSTVPRASKASCALLITVLGTTGGAGQTNWPTFAGH